MSVDESNELANTRLTGQGDEVRLFVATDVRLIPQAGGGYVSTHPSVSDAALERYTATGWPCTLVARVEDSPARSGSAPLADPRIGVYALVGDTKQMGLVRRLVCLFWAVRKLPVTRRDVVVVRLPELVSVIVWLRAKMARAVVVSNLVADASAVAAAFGRFAVVFRWPLHLAVRAMVWRSSAVVYVTRVVMQKAYPSRPRTPTMAASNVKLTPSSFSETPRVYDWDQNARRITLVAVGTQESLGKGHDLLIRGVVALRAEGHDVAVGLVGDGVRQPELRALAAQLGVADYVTFHGFVAERCRLESILRTADIFVMPSRAEGLPRAMVEAMAMGLCCLGSKLGGMPELAPPDALFEPGDAESLHACVARVLGSPARASAIAERQWRLARDIYLGTDPVRFVCFLRQLVEERC